MSWTPWAVAAATLLLAATTTLAATPAGSCRSGKNKEAGNYVECRQKAESKFALRGDAAARARVLERCAEKYGAKWQQLEGRAGGACPSTGDQTAIQQHLDTTSTDVALALAGRALAGQAQPLKTGQTGCWNAAGQAVPCAGTGQDGAIRNGVERAYVDNGDGTITDLATGLMWEKLSDDTGIHDKDNTYTWPNAFNYKIATLNAERFAGYADWRVPNLAELRTLVDYGRVGPAVSPAFENGCVPWCTVLNCSCTLGGNTYWYWTSTSFQPFAASPWAIFFYNGVVDRTHAATEPMHVRAVRGGS